MQEIIINSNKNKDRMITLVEDGVLLEKYEETSDSQRIEGNIYIGKVENILKGMQAAFVDIGTGKNTFIHLKDIIPKVDITKEKMEDISNTNINNVIKTNMPILVQVKRDCTNKKGARVSSHVSLSSRFFVLMPDTNIITISQKIIDVVEKERLINIVKRCIPNDMGVIIRTSSENKEEVDLITDLNNVVKRWNGIKEKTEEKNMQIPRLIEKNIGIIEKMILDTIDSGMKKITVNDSEIYDEIQDILKRIGCEEYIELVNNNVEDVLDKYDLNSQIEKASNRKIWLKCGGFITIDKTEALTAIDVNSGKYIGKDNLEKTVLKVNKEASDEIAKQLRLRDVGGIIVIDYIDMSVEENKDEVVKILEDSLKSDRSKTQVLGFTKLNLVEMTRKHICSNE